MPIEVRCKASDEGWLADVLIVCCHCGEEVENQEEGVATWFPENRYIPGTILFAEYAHEGCDNGYRSRIPAGPGHASAVRKTNIPLRRFFDLLLCEP